MNTCQTCRYWLPTGSPSDDDGPVTRAEAVMGDCRRYAPHPVVTLEPQRVAIAKTLGHIERDMLTKHWPHMLENDWCGEWAALGFE